MRERRDAARAQAGRAEAPASATIDSLRAQIDRIDGELVRLLNERASCAFAIGELKKTQGMAIYQPDREKAVLQHVRAVDATMGGPLGAEAIGRVFERIIDEARRIERLRVTEGREPAGSQE